MTIPKHPSNQDDDILKDGQVLHVPMFAMDSVQRSVAASTMNVSHHRPGYRLNTQLVTDSAARDALQDVYDQYERIYATRGRRQHQAPSARRRMSNYSMSSLTTVLIPMRRTTVVFLKLGEGHEK